MWKCDFSWANNNWTSRLEWNTYAYKCQHSRLIFSSHMSMSNFHCVYWLSINFDIINLFNEINILYFASYLHNEMPQTVDILTYAKQGMTHLTLSILSLLTHLPLDKMAAILADDILKCSLMKIIKFWFKFHWNLFPAVQLTINQHWFAKQVTSHFLNQWWQSSLTHICSTRGRWVNNFTMWAVNQ